MLPPVPDDAIVVHIGLHKTGTTAMQSRFGAARADLRTVGINYPGFGDAHHDMAQALLRWHAHPDQPDLEAEQQWRRFAGRVADIPGRVVLSSEFLSRLDAETVQRFVKTLGPDRVQVVVGVRHLGAVALSAWQQSLKTGHVRTLGQWLRHNFAADDDGRLTGWYWRKQHPSRAVSTWADVVGPDRVFTIISDDSDFGQLPRVFEHLLGLDSGMLGDRPAGMANRSMTAAEARLARAVNAELRGQIEQEHYLRLIRYGMLRRMVENRVRGEQEAPLALPDTAAQLAAREGELVAREIEKSGVHVIGELRNLVDPPKRKLDPDVELTSELPVEAAVQAVVGLVGAATHGDWRMTQKPARAVPTAPPVSEPPAAVVPPARPAAETLPMKALLALVVRRLGAGVRWRLRKWRRGESNP